MSKLDNFVFDGVNYRVGEKIRVTHKMPGYHQKPHRDYVGKLVYIGTYKSFVRDMDEINFILDSDVKHLMSLRFIEKIERITQ